MFGGWGGANIGAWGGGSRGAASLQEEDPLAPPGAIRADLSDVDLGAQQHHHPNHHLGGAGGREAAVARREAALSARERELEAREAALRRSAGPPKNWPVCCPFVHHDIATDVPPHLRPAVKQAYAAYLGLIFCLLLNLAGALSMLGAPKADDKMSSVFLAIIYVLAGVPLALIGWYLRLYNAAASDAALGFFGFFIAFGIHTAFCIWASIALPLAGERWSMTGFIAAMRAFDEAKYAGILFLVGASFWVLEALWSLWTLKTVYFAFRSSGKHTQANAEISRIALKAAAGHHGVRL